MIFLILKLGNCLYENGQCLGVPGYPVNVAPVLNFFGEGPEESLKKNLANSKDILFDFLSPKFCTCLYKNGQCLRVPGYPGNEKLN